METADKITTRLEKLREFVRILERLKGVTEEELQKDIDKSAKAERYLQLAIEVCIDISEMLIAEEKLPAPQTARQVIERLGEAGILEPQFAKEFAKSAGMRNILIHDYTKIDYKEVADKINNRLGDFDTFAKAVAKHLNTRIK